MLIPWSKLWKAFWILLSATVAGIVLLLAALAFHFRTQVVLTDYAEGEGADRPYGMAGKGNLLTRHPARVLQVEFQHGGSADAEDHIYFARVPLSSDELVYDLQFWQSDPDLKFQHSGVSHEPPPDYWPNWFPHPSASTYVGTVVTPHGWQVEVYRASNDPAYAYLVY